MSFHLGELSKMCGCRLEDKTSNPGRNSNSGNDVYNVNKGYIIFPITVANVNSAPTAAVQNKHRRLLKRDVIIRC